MSIAFDSSRWENIRSISRKWWAGKLDRPLIPARVLGRDPGRPEPRLPLLGQGNCHDFSITPEQIIDRIDYDLSCYHFLGDAFPYFNMDCFGPGIIAAFLGAKLDNSTGRVWFHPPADTPVAELHFQFDPDNVWFQRVCDIYREGMRRWQGEVLMGMTDIGGVVDILSSFRPGDALLMDLYDEPEEVKRLVGEIHESWHHYYDALNEVLQPVNPGYSDWSRIYSDTPAYILQSDFSYMISPEMFDEFVLPELAASCRKLGRPFYHLDGKGQLPHLDSLLRIPELAGVQWIPGDGQPDCRHWPEVYQKIAGVGKKIQLIGDLQTLDAVACQIGSTKEIFLWSGSLYWSSEDIGSLRKELARHGIS